ncbi:transposable element Tcb1 transposase [Trichonephila clavipes]|nr:transposable element Tcb1 transposase [Trichonephila clavipes]
MNETVRCALLLHGILRTCVAPPPPRVVGGHSLGTRTQDGWSQDEDETRFKSSLTSKHIDDEICILAQTQITGDRRATCKRYMKGEQIGDLKYSNCFPYFFLRKLFASWRASFDQVSEFNPGRIADYRDCGLPFREIGQCFGRNQATVMKEETTHRWRRSHPPRCTTVRDDMRIVRMAVMDSAPTPRTIAHNRFSLLRIIQCPLVPLDAVCKRV